MQKSHFFPNEWLTKFSLLTILNHLIIICHELYKILTCMAGKQYWGLDISWMWGGMGSLWTSHTLGWRSSLWSGRRLGHGSKRSEMACYTRGWRHTMASPTSMWSARRLAAPCSIRRGSGAPPPTCSPPASRGGSRFWYTPLCSRSSSTLEEVRGRWRDHIQNYELILNFFIVFLWPLVDIIIERTFY